MIFPYSYPYPYPYCRSRINYSVNYFHSATVNICLQARLGLIFSRRREKAVCNDMKQRRYKFHLMYSREIIRNFPKIPWSFNHFIANQLYSYMYLSVPFSLTTRPLPVHINQSSVTCILTWLLLFVAEPFDWESGDIHAVPCVTASVQSGGTWTEYHGACHDRRRRWAFTISELFIQFFYNYNWIPGALLMLCLTLAAYHCPTD